MEDLKKYKLLVVDDQEDFKDTLTALLEETGFTVLSADSGLSAFEIIKQHPIDLVVSDMRMPNGDGMMLLDLVRKLNPDVPLVIIITGYSNFSKEEIMNKGAVDLIRKPFRTDDFIAIIKKSLKIS